MGMPLGKCIAGSRIALNEFQRKGMECTWYVMSAGINRVWLSRNRNFKHVSVPQIIAQYSIDS